MHRVSQSICVFVFGSAAVALAAPRAQTQTAPIIYSTDLYHPHEDPDDHFDLATLFAIAEFDLRAIVIDMGARGAGRPGTVALEQIMHITGRRVPYATGLLENLRSPEDRADQQPASAENGAALILKSLRESTTRTIVFCTGSLRDVAAAFNRDPELFKTKVARLYVNAGHSTGGREHNVGLDPHAYVRILRSGLPVYWVPCFGDGGYLSHWRFRQGDVLETAPPALQNFFFYALITSPDQRDLLSALRDTWPRELREKVWAQPRNMWCTAAFLHAAGRRNDTFTFKDVGVRLDEHGATTIDASSDLKRITFYRPDAAAYEESMRETLCGLFAGIPSPP